MVSKDEIQYCLNALLRIDGYDCETCGKRGTDKCKEICHYVEKRI